MSSTVAQTHTQGKPPRTYTRTRTQKEDEEEESDAGGESGADAAVAAAAAVNGDAEYANHICKMRAL